MRRYTSSFSSNSAVETLSAKDWWFPGSSPGSITDTNQILKCRYLQFALSAKDWWFPCSSPGSITGTNQIPKCRYLQFPLSVKDWWFPGSSSGSITDTNQIPKCRYLLFLTLRWRALRPSVYPPKCTKGISDRWRLSFFQNSVQILIFFITDFCELKDFGKKNF